MPSTGWSVERMPDQDGRTVIVTGANSGLGFEIARALALHGARVVLACRNIDRGETAAVRIRDERRDASLDVRVLDLASLASIRNFADDFAADYDDLHVLCNNAGVMAIPRRTTDDGFEMQLGVNYLGHFALTGLLLDRLLETPGETRVVTVSSKKHEEGDIDFFDLQSERSYDPMDAYARSKLANLLFAFELQRRLGAVDANAKSVAAHPGYADTNLQRRGPDMARSPIRQLGVRLANALAAQSARRGALPILYAATMPTVSGGDFYGPDGFMELRGAPARVEASARARDPELARRLWSVSEELTGVQYDRVAPAQPP
ncbi:oxidoreductase [Haloferacaceae archaeon DSL9]